jgi:hypothetical protein
VASAARHATKAGRGLNWEMQEGFGHWGYEQACEDAGKGGCASVGCTCACQPGS